MNSVAITLLQLALISQEPAVSPTVSPAPSAAAAITDTAAKKDGSLEEPPFDPTSYSYNPFGKRDPFRSYLMDKDAAAEVRDPLLSYELSSFNLTGIIWGITNPRGIVRDPSGHGHIIARGTMIGRNRGHVTRILKEEILVTEEFRDPLGKLIVSEFAMKLNKKGK